MVLLNKEWRLIVIKRELKIKNFTKIPYEYMKGDSIIDKDKLLLLTYILMTNNNKNVCVFNIKWLCEAYNTTSKNSKKIKFIKDSLKEFQDKDIFYFSKDLFGDCKLDVNTSKINNSDLIFAQVCSLTDTFTVIYDEDIVTLTNYCNSDNRIDKNGLVYLYIHISSFINENPNNENYKLGYPSIKLLESQTGLSNKTILRYRKILKELGIINHDYIGRNSVGSELKLTNTYYCRMEDTEKLQERMRMLNCMTSVQKLSIDDKQKINNKRSIKQRINNLNKKEVLSPQETKTLAELELQYSDLCGDDNSTLPSGGVVI